MPMVEVDELELQQSRQLRSTIEGYRKNPKAWRKLLEAQKIANPDTKIPELDDPDPVEEIRKATSDQIAELSKKFDDEKAARERDAKLSSLQATRDAGFAELRRQRWTDDGLKAVEKIMEEKGILDPLDAAAIFEKAHPPQAPITPSGSGAYNFMELPADGDEDIKRLIASRGENDAVTEKIARDTLRAIRS